MPVIDDMTVLAAGLRRSPSPQRQKRRAAEEALQPVIVDPGAQAMPDKAGRHRVENTAQGEAAGRCDMDDRLFVIGRAPLGQRLQFGTLRLDALAAMRIPASDDLIEEAAVGRQIGEVTRATQQQGVRDGLFQMAVRALDRAVLMRDTRIIARRLHAVMGDQLFIAPGQVIAGVAVEIAERRRQTVGPVLLGHAAQCPKRVLQAFGKRHETLAAQDHRGSACRSR
jgi:hypothetical protein